MAGTVAPNKPIFYRDVTEIQARLAEVGGNAEKFTDGCNRGVANGAVGINTGDYDPKITDFPRITHFGGPASYIGKLAEATANFEDSMVGLLNEGDQASEISKRVGFDVAGSATADGADYGTLPVTNLSGKTIPSGGWAWGFEAVGGDPVAPIVDAGGPYGPRSGSGTVTGVVTPGTDLSPVLQWTVLSGGTGTFTDPTSAITTFNPTSGNGTYTLVLTATPDDGPAVSDTASYTVIIPE